MDVLRAFKIVVLSAAGFGVAGTSLGFLIGSIAPVYYRYVFDAKHDPNFDPVGIGMTLGLIQGIVCGIAIGLIVVLSVALSHYRRGRADERCMKESSTNS